jgi:hypothetical protein
MQKQFGQEYMGKVKGFADRQAQRNQLAMGDIEKKYCWWICLSGKKIGFINAPVCYDPKGAESGRYLDTRWIEPEHRAQGHGTQAFRLLQDQHYIMSIKLRANLMYENWRYWHRLGYGHAVMAGLIDKEHRNEIDALKDDVKGGLDSALTESLYWYVLDSKGPELALLNKYRYPIIKTDQFFQQQEQPA